MASQQQRVNRWIRLATALLTLLLLIIAVTIWLDRKQTLSGNPLPGENRDTLHTITIERPDRPLIRLQLKNQLWTMIEPCELPVNMQRLQPLLSIAEPSTHVYDAAEVDLDAAGLLTPLAVITMNDTAILIGSTDLSDERRYIRRNDTVEFIPEWILSLVNGGLSAIANLDIFPDEIESLEVQGTEQTHRLTGEQLTAWQSLTAQQIVEWPIANTVPFTRQTVKALLNNGELLVELYEYPDYTALVYKQSGCAFLVPNASMPHTNAAY